MGTDYVHGIMWAKLYTVSVIKDPCVHRVSYTHRAPDSADTHRAPYTHCAYTCTLTVRIHVHVCNTSSASILSIPSPRFGTCFLFQIQFTPTPRQHCCNRASCTLFDTAPTPAFPQTSEAPHPMTQNTQNGHVIAPAATSAAARPLPDICFTLRRKVIAFLDQQPSDDDRALSSAQAQTRASIELVQEALRRYG